MSDIGKPLSEFFPVTSGEDLLVELPPEDGMDAIIEEVEGSLKEALPHTANLAAFLDTKAAASLVLRCIELFDSDRRSRSEWEEDYRNNLRLLGLKVENRSVPWEGACGVMHPMIAEAAIRFQATTAMEMFPLSGPFKSRVVGRTDEKLTEASVRLAREFNFIATQEMHEYRTEVEQGLWRLGLAGIGFRKVWFDPVLRRPVAETIPADDIVVPYSAAHIYSSPRIAHIMRKTRTEVDKLMASGWWLDVDIPAPAVLTWDTEEKEKEQTGQDHTGEDDRYEIIDLQIDLDLEGFEHIGPDGVADGLPQPYVVTIEKQNLTLLAVRRNWQESDPTFTREQHISAACYIPGWGFYGIGLLSLMAGLATGATSILRQAVDAGTLANLPAGFKGAGLRVKSDNTPLRPGEFREVDLFAGKIGESIFQMKFPEPSGALIGMMGSMIETGRSLGSIAELPTKTGEMPVGTIVAMIEHQTKPQSAVQARVYAAFAEELKMIRKIVENTRDGYKAPGNEGHDLKADLALPIALEPVSDPGATTSAVRILQAQAAVEMSSKNPMIYDQPAVHRAMLVAMGVGDVNAFVPDKNDIPPSDPISEKMALLTGKPVKAGDAQDHKAHIRAHMSLTEDPRMAKLVGQGPNAQTVVAAIAAHLAEHAAYLHRKEVFDSLGLAVPTGPMDPAMEAMVAPLLAEAASKSADHGKAIAAEEQAKQQAEDPVMQLEKADLMLRKEKQDEDAKLKAAKMKLDYALAVQELKLKAAEVGARIAKQGVDAAKEKLQPPPRPPGR